MIAGTHTHVSERGSARKLAHCWVLGGRPWWVFPPLPGGGGMRGFGGLAALAYRQQGSQRGRPTTMPEQRQRALPSCLPSPTPISALPLQHPPRAAPRPQLAGRSSPARSPAEEARVQGVWVSGSEATCTLSHSAKDESSRGAALWGVAWLAMRAPNERESGSAGGGAKAEGEVGSIVGESFRGGEHEGETVLRLRKENWDFRFLGFPFPKSQILPVRPGGGPPWLFELMLGGRRT